MVDLSEITQRIFTQAITGQVDTVLVNPMEVILKDINGHTINEVLKQADAKLTVVEEALGSI